MLTKTRLPCSVSVQIRGFAYVVSLSASMAECVSSAFTSVLTESLDNWSGTLEREGEGSRRTEIAHTHLSVRIKAPPPRTLAFSSQVCVRLVSPSPVSSVLSCHLLREEDLSFWLYLSVRGERECSLTKSSGNLYWGNMVSRKPSRKT